MADRLCVIAGCDRPLRARGWCTLHYQRWQRHGDPTTYVGYVGRPQAPLTHGSRRMYDLGCRCLPCAVVESRYKAAHSRGERARVSAEQVRAHLAELVASGWTRQAITQEAGIGTSTLWYVEHRARWVNSRTADAILSVEPLPGRIILDSGPLVDAIRARKTPLARLLDDPSDQRAYFRALNHGTVSDDVADRLSIRALGLTLEELYGPDWDRQVAA